MPANDLSSLPAGTGLPSAATRRATPNPQSSALLIVVRLLSALTALIKSTVLLATQES